MSNTKKKVLVVAIAVCLIAIVSLSTLAWFNAADDAQNNFYIANSEDDADDIFSVDVWEDDTEEDTDGETKLDDMEIENVLPGDVIYKEVHIENTGYYDQYVRATVTVTGASVWQDVYGKRLVPLTEIVQGVDESAIHTMVSYYDAANDAFVYELYYDKAIAAGQEIIVFETVTINSALDRFQAAELSGQFSINVVADAVQVNNVGDNVYEAFNTVGLVTAVPVSDAAALDAALASDEPAYIVLDGATDWNITIDQPISNKTIDFNGTNGTIVFGANAVADNVVVSGIVDTDGQTPSIETNVAFTGELTITGCHVADYASQPYGAMVLRSGDIAIDNCVLEALAGKTYCLYYSGAFNGNLTITDTTFVGFNDSWAININNAFNGNLTIDGCVFEGQDGVLKVLSGINGDFTFTNNTLIGCNGHDGKGTAYNFCSTSKNTPLAVSGTTTFTGNTLDGADWNP